VLLCIIIIIIIIIIITVTVAVVTNPITATSSCCGTVLPIEHPHQAAMMSHYYHALFDVTFTSNALFLFCSPLSSLFSRLRPNRVLSFTECVAGLHSFSVSRVFSSVGYVNRFMILLCIWSAACGHVASTGTKWPELLQFCVL
jgi:hypothetical protein